MNLGVTEEPRGSGGKLGSPTHDGQQVVPIICPFPSPFLQVDRSVLLLLMDTPVLFVLLLFGPFMCFIDKNDSLPLNKNNSKKLKILSRLVNNVWSLR